MKALKMLVLGLAVAPIVSFAQVNAVSSGKLISHKEWGVPNIKLTYRPIQTKLNDFNVFRHKSKDAKHDQLLMSSDKISNFQLSEKNPSSVTAEGYNFAYISNNTLTEQFYNVTHSVCVYKSEGQSPEQCSHSSEFIAVAAGEETGNSHTSSMEWSNILPGEYVISFSTSIENSASTVLYSSYDAKFISVPEKAKA